MKSKGNRADARLKVTYSDVGQSNSTSKGIVRVQGLSEIEYYAMLAKVKGQGKMKSKGNRANSRSDVTYSDARQSNSTSKGIVRVRELSEIEYYAMLAKVGVHHYYGNNVDLSIACGKC
ncbi:hypothetical protein KIW84_011822 [Lathyrus oleraceus]|uniref:Uncharacterized protein n=1 Tax=Pisum sativum TaxID=3888 RepID=A0A9D5BG03_PEA|nr:hypothetical protein KIW84_011822 [Pisum sativum]